MRNSNPSSVRESEFRMAVSQTHNCEIARVEEIVRVTIARRPEPIWEGEVHVFELRGHNTAKRCYAWPEAISQTATIIHAVLCSKTISSPAQAVRSVYRLRGIPGLRMIWRPVTRH